MRKSMGKQDENEYENYKSSAILLYKRFCVEFCNVKTNEHWSERMRESNGREKREKKLKKSYSNGVGKMKKENKIEK